MVGELGEHSFRSDPIVDQSQFRFNIQRTPRELTDHEQEILDSAWDEYDHISTSAILGVTGFLNFTVGMHPVFSKMVRYLTGTAAVISGTVLTSFKWGMQLTDMDEWILLHTLEK